MKPTSVPSRRSLVAPTTNSSGRLEDRRHLAAQAPEVDRAGDVDRRT